MAERRVIFNNRYPPYLLVAPQSVVLMAHVIAMTAIQFRHVERKTSYS